MCVFVCVCVSVFVDEVRGHFFPRNTALCIVQSNCVLLEKTEEKITNMNVMIRVITVMIS